MVDQQIHVGAFSRGICDRLGFRHIETYPIDAVQPDIFWISRPSVDLSSPGAAQFLRKCQTESSA
jgi:hypothetical protein